MKPTVALAVVPAVFGAAVSHATVLTGPIVNPANGHEYYLLDSDSWTNSEAEAVTLGGHLVTINDAAENQWVFDTFGSFGGVNRHLWTGLNDADAEGAFTWSSGESVAYENWAPGEPNDLTGEDYVHLWSSDFAPFSQWNDVDNDPSNLSINGVVEVVPEPSSMMLLGAAAFTLMARRRRSLRS